MSGVYKKNLSDFSFFTAGDGTILKEIFHPSQHLLTAGYSVAYAYLLPETASKPHSLEASELYLFLSGKGRFFLEGKELEVNKGDLVFVPPGASQMVENTGSEDLVFYCIVEPPWKPESEKIYDSK